MRSTEVRAEECDPEVPNDEFWQRIVLSLLERKSDRQNRIVIGSLEVRSCDLVSTELHEPQNVDCKSGERGRNRTYNLLIKSQLLCQLSYAPFAYLWDSFWNI
jgi:hypothetical protein